MSSISVKGVLLGALFDGVVSTVLGFVIVFTYAVWLGIADPDDMQRLTESSGLYALAFAASGLVSTIAGYLAARIAGKGELLNGMLATLVAMIVSLIIVLAMSSGDFSMLDVVGYAVAPLFGLLGGYLRFRQVN